MSKPKIGDLVRFRSNSRIPPGLTQDAVGTVVTVEPQPPLTGPTFKVRVKFGEVVLPHMFESEFEVLDNFDGTEASRQI